MLEFILISFLIELTPGPNMGYLAALALERGLKAGLAAVLGVGLGLAAIGVLALSGVLSLASPTPAMSAVLRYGGTLFFLYLAVDAWRDPAPEAQAAGLWQPFWRSFVTNLLNPKAALFYVTVLPEFAAEAGMESLSGLALFLSVYVAVASGVHFLVVAFASQLRGFLNSQTHQRALRRGAALMLLCVALWFFWKAGAVQAT